MSNLDEAVEHCDLARLLGSKEDVRDDEVREQIRKHIELTRAKLDLAESKLDEEDKLQGGNDE